MSSDPAKPTSLSNVYERTKIANGGDNVIQHTLNFVSNAAERIDACIDNIRPSLLAEIEQLRDAFENTKNRGITLNYVTGITKENISYCKQLIQFVSELHYI